jgi:hypothetical protein
MSFGEGGLGGKCLNCSVFSYHNKSGAENVVFFLTKISTYISGCCVSLEIIRIHVKHYSFENIACPKKSGL